MFEILVILIDSMCGDPILDLLYLAIPTVLLGAGAFFLMGKDNRKKIEEIFRSNWAQKPLLFAISSIVFF